MIRSTIPTRYTNRIPLKAIIEICITEWKYEPIGQRYVATVEDYAILTDEEGNETKQMINTKQVYYSVEQINTLFQYIGNPIQVSDDFSDKLLRLIASALMYVTCTDLNEDGTTIYGLQPNEWFVNDNYEMLAKRSKK